MRARRDARLCARTFSPSRMYVVERRGKERKALRVLSSVLYTNGSIMQVTGAAEVESYEPCAHLVCYEWSQARRLRKIRPMKTGREAKRIRPPVYRGNRRMPPYRAECSPRQGTPKIAGAANSNVKLDFRVDFSGTRRKALQASPRLQSGRD